MNSIRWWSKSHDPDHSDQRIALHGSGSAAVDPADPQPEGGLTMKQELHEESDPRVAPLDAGVVGRDLPRSSNEPSPSSVKYTPGPWTSGLCIESDQDRLPKETARSGDKYFVRSRSASRNSDVCLVHHTYESHEGTSKANASLIASAPELLKALKAASEELFLMPHSPLRLQINDAIQKAEGR